MFVFNSESRHPSGPMILPPPLNSTTKPVLKTPYCKLSKLKKSQSSGHLSLTNNGNGTNSKTSNNHATIKQRTSDTQSQPNLHTGNSPRSPLDNSQAGGHCVNNGNAIPTAGQLGTPALAASATVAGGFANALGGLVSTTTTTTSSTTTTTSPVKSPGNQPKRKRLKTERLLLKDREYDPDRHCGVWNEETGKPCTRSLTCKAHTVLLRRSVTGRSKSFDKLLADHRASKESPSTRNVQGNSAKAVAVNVVVPAVSNNQNNNNNSQSNNNNNNQGNVPAAAVVAVSIAASTIAVEPVSASNAPHVAGNVIDASSALMANNSSLPDLEAPSSPPVLSLPDTYPLPQVNIERAISGVGRWIFEFAWWPLSFW